MREVGRDLWAWLAEVRISMSAATPKRMAKDVERALVDIVAQTRRAHDRRGDRFRGRAEEKGPLSQDVY